MRVAHINVISSLSTGNVAVGICETVQEMGHRALLCYSRGNPPRAVPGYRIGNRVDKWLHGVGARLLDRSGFFSHRATRRLIRQLAG